MKNKKWELVNFCEFDKYAAKSYCAIHNVDESKNLGDITKVDENELEDFNMICGGSPCFVAGTKVYTSKGYKNIEDVKVGDMVLTLQNNMKEVENIGSTLSQNIYELKAQGILPIYATSNHPFYVRTSKYIYKENKSKIKNLSEIRKKELCDLSKEDYIGVPILDTNENVLNLTKEECWILGRYVADGCIKNRNIVLAIGINKLNQLKRNIIKTEYKVGLNSDSCYYCRIKNERLYFIAKDYFKYYAINKNIPNEILNLPIDLLESFLNGYFAGDGCVVNDYIQATTISRELALDLVLAVQKVYKVGCRVYYDKKPSTYMIQGREVSQNDTYMIRFNKKRTKQCQYFVYEDAVWYPIRSIEFKNKDTVYNIQVEDDHTYIANGCYVSNCQDFSISGKQKGSVWTCNDCTGDDGKPFEYNPLTVHWSKRDCCPRCGSKNIDKTRSSLLVEYLRVIRVNKPNFGIYENVKNIVGKRFKDTTFKLFTDELEEYGYNVYWKVLNAKHFGIPQNRERVYLIFIRKDLDNGKFKFPEPFDNGLRLKDMLEDEVDEKFYISEDKVKHLVTNLNNANSLLYDPCQVKRKGKSREHTEYAPTLTSRDYKDPRLINENVVKQVGNIFDCDGAWDNPQVGRVYSPDVCSPTLNTCSGGGHEPKIICGCDKSYNNPNIIENANCITSREDRGISNRKQEGTAVIENNCTDKDVLKIPDISYCLEASYYKGTTVEEYLKKHRRQLVFENNNDKDNADMVAVKQATKQGYIECEVGGVADLSYPDSKTRRGRVQDNGKTCPIITETEMGICKIESTLENISHAEWKQKMYKKYIEDSCGEVSGVVLNQSRTFGYRPPTKGYSKTLKAISHDIGIVNGIRIRKLTPRETFRLMGFSDTDFDTAQNAGISNSQLYKQAGNSIVVDVLYYIYRELYKAMPYLFDNLKLSSFFSGIGAFESGLDRLYEDINSGNFTKPQTE